MFSFQHDLYPTVGLQTPGEVVEANFGQLPFVFDIEDYMRVSFDVVESIYSEKPLPHPFDMETKKKKKKTFSGITGSLDI